MRYDTITEIDFHCMRAEEAVKTLSKVIENAPASVYRIRVIHGYKGEEKWVVWYINGTDADA